MFFSYESIFESDELPEITSKTRRTPYEIVFGHGVVRVDYNNKRLVIKNINYQRFLVRIRDMYMSQGLLNVFNKKYTYWSEYMWRHKKITANQRKVSQLEIPLFFALEIHEIFHQLSEFYKLPYYNRVAKDIYKNTWISNYEKRNSSEFDVKDSDFLKNFKIEPKDYQKEFILNYKRLKYIYDLEGYILSFDQGLGKTFTATALSELLNKDRIIIVCPNSLKENWAYEIKSYYYKYDDDMLWRNEIYIHGSAEFNKLSKQTKYIIVNQEAISKIMSYVNSDMEYMIIVDESHNFRNMKANRVEQLLKLKSITKCKDVLMMSGTPIKAIPNEIVPALLMIDPYFTEELATIYTKAFNSDRTTISEIVKARFDRTMYRKTKKEVLSLPEKYVEPLRLSINAPEKYYMTTLQDQISELFDTYYAEKLKENNKLSTEFSRMVRKYSDAGTVKTEAYLSYITNTTNTGKSQQIHDYDRYVFNTFLKDHVYPNIHDPNQYKKMKELHSKYIYMINSAIGLANGEVLPKARANCYIDIYNENYELIHQMILDNSKKTIIFTPYTKVCTHIYQHLNKSNIGAVKIDGGTQNRMDEIQRFKEDDNIDVLVATTQTLSTGVTLTEATQMFFFGTPWRSADYDQATDRIYRIGQTHDVYIYNIFLDTEERNITNSMEDTLEWSGQMFDSMIN